MSGREPWRAGNGLHVPVSYYWGAWSCQTKPWGPQPSSVLKKLNAPNRNLAPLLHLQEPGHPGSGAKHRLSWPPRSQGRRRGVRGDISRFVRLSCKHAKNLGPPQGAEEAARSFPHREKWGGGAAFPASAACHHSLRTGGFWGHISIAPRQRFSNGKMLRRRFMSQSQLPDSPQFGALGAGADLWPPSTSSHRDAKAKQLLLLPQTGGNAVVFYPLTQQHRL